MGYCVPYIDIISLIQSGGVIRDWEAAATPFVLRKGPAQAVIIIYDNRAMRGFDLKLSNPVIATGFF